MEAQCRKWMRLFLTCLVLLQFYFIQELIAVFLLFTVVFTFLASVVGSIYMLQCIWIKTVDYMDTILSPVGSEADAGD